MISMLVFIFFMCVKVRGAVNRTNFDTCKVTHRGQEYMGKISTTESGLICQQWDTRIPIHPIHMNIEDNDFFDGKMSSNENYCRNIRGMHDSPWCYTLDRDVIDEVCDVPLCSFTECRISGIGAEYGGDKNTTITNKNCVMWSETIYRKYESFRGRSVTSNRYLLDKKYPDQSRRKAENKCRNPTGDLNGPWCFIETEIESDIFQYDKDYCEIPLCNNPECPLTTVATHRKPIHYHFSKLPDTTQLVFSVQLWNPENWKDAKIYIALSCYPLPMTGDMMRNINNGIEIQISHTAIGFTEGFLEDPSWKSYTGALSGIRFTKFILSWVPGGGYISIESPDLMKQPIIIEYTTANNTILGSFDGKFQYYSIMGGPVIWDFGSCAQICDEHVTSNDEYFRFIKMGNTSSNSRIIQFFLRTSKQAFVELRNGPVRMYPTIRIEILNNLNMTTISFLVNKKILPVFLGDVKFNAIITPYQWNEFFISVITDRLQMVWIRRTVSQTIFNVQHPYFRDVRWIGISSKYAANWVFHCNKKDLPLIPDSFVPPECVYSTSSYHYNGTKWVNSENVICLPWIHPEVQKIVDESKLVEKSFSLARNYCRNPTYDSKGPYCYVTENYGKQGSNIIQKFCSPPKCMDSECKLSNGETYLGNVNVTATGRTCQKWHASAPFQIPKEYFNNVHANLTFATNQCRNPVGSFLGPFCYTTDPKAMIDSCEIKECYMPNSCTVIFRPTDKPGRSILLKPEWLLDKIRFSIKIWESGGKIANIGFIIKYRNSSQFFTLNVGSNEGDTISLIYTDENGLEKTLKKHLIPLIIPLGSWRGLWLRVPPNVLEFGFENEESNPIFSWSSSEDSNVFYSAAAYVTVVVLNTFHIGINFPSTYCIIEKVETSFPTVLYHVNVWGQNDGLLSVYVMTETDNANGQIIISLFPWHEREYRVYIGTNFINICLYESSPQKCEKTLINYRIMFNKNSWTTYYISTLNGTTLEVRDKDKKLLASWNPDFAVYFYYFSVSALQLSVYWTANCEYPTDIYADPINGGWGEWNEWVCNVPCGRGVGYKTRECNNPTPNILGQPCAGSSRLDGICNEFTCGTLSPNVLNRTNERKSTMNHTIYTEEYSKASLPCYLDIIAEMKNQSPSSEYEWLKDGFPLKNTRLTLQKLTLENSYLNLSDVQLSDSGLYICIIRPSYKIEFYDFIPIKIISFIVTSNSPTEYRRESMSMHLHCNSPILQLFYANLVQLWVINDLLYLDYGPTEFNEIDNDEVDAVEKYHEGIWKCIVEQRALNLTWVTAWKKVAVLPAPTWISYLSEEDAPRVFFYFLRYYPNVIKTILIILLLMTIILIGLLDYYYIKWRQELLHGL